MLFNNTKYMKILGIDEAGRGAVIGPLVITGVILNQDHLHKINGLKDSKKLTPSKRLEIFNKFNHNVRLRIIEIYPKEIDDALESKELNLNWLEARKIAVIINHLKPDKAIIDCPSSNKQSFLTYLKEYLTTNPKIILEHQADEKYPVVALASIFSKVTRDTIVKEIEDKIKKNIGSGYPSDPRTKEFLKKYHKDYVNIIRTSWQTYKKLTKKKKQTTLDKF